MTMFRIDVFLHGGSEKHTEVGFFPNYAAADAAGEAIRRRIDPDAMYDVCEITGIRRAYYAALAKKRHFSTSKSTNICA